MLLKKISALINLKIKKRVNNIYLFNIAPSES